MFNWSSSTSSGKLQSVKSLSSPTSFGRTFLNNLIRSPLYHSLTSLDKTKLWSKFYVDNEENVRKVLEAVSVDQKVITNPRANQRRRTVLVTRNDIGQPFGFTLQTYLLKRKGEDVASKLTYVDYVQLDSPAADAGIRAGDVIISINGCIVTKMSHEALIELIGSCRQMRMVIIFENIRQRVELIARAIKLRKILNDKLHQLNLIDIEEQKILNRVYIRLMANRNNKHSLANSLSSTGASSASSVSSAPSERSNDCREDVAAEQTIPISTITAPTINSANNEIDKFPMKRVTLEKLDFSDVSSSKRWTKLPPDSGRSKVMDAGLELIGIQRICCNGTDLENFDPVSLSSSRMEQDDSAKIANIISHDNTVGSTDSSDNNSCVTDDGDGDNDDDDGDDESSVKNESDTLSEKSVEVTVPETRAVFNSVALNHVIRLDDDVSNSYDDCCEYIQVLKL